MGPPRLHHQLQLVSRRWWRGSKKSVFKCMYIAYMLHAWCIPCMHVTHMVQSWAKSHGPLVAGIGLFAVLIISTVLTAGFIVSGRPRLKAPADPLLQHHNGHAEEGCGCWGGMQSSAVMEAVQCKRVHFLVSVYTLLFCLYVAATMLSGFFTPISWTLGISASSNG